jgi:hypothetical protein
MKEENAAFLENEGIDEQTNLRSEKTQFFAQGTSPKNVIQEFHLGIP